MHQQPPGPDRVLVEDVALLIGGDVHPMNEQLPVLYCTIGVLQVQRTGPNGFDLCSSQLHAGLVPVLHEVVVKGLAVLRRDLDSLFLRGAHLSSAGIPDTGKVKLVYHDSARSSRERSSWLFLADMI